MMKRALLMSQLMFWMIGWRRSQGLVFQRPCRGACRRVSSFASFASSGRTFTTRQVSSSLIPSQPSTLHPLSPHSYYVSRCRSRLRDKSSSLSSSSRLFSSASSSDNKSHLHHNNHNILSSTKGNTIRLIQNLLKKPKARAQHNKAVIEGPKFVLDFLQNPRTRRLVDQIVVSEQYYNTNSMQQQLEEEYQISPKQIQIATDQVFQSLSGVVTNQGILAVVDIPQFQVEDIFFSSLDDDDDDQSSSSSKLILILDGVSDPGNVGTLIRSSLAAGISGIFLLPGSCDPYNPKVIRSAVGAQFLVPCLDMDSMETCLSMIHQLQIDSTNTITITKQQEDFHGIDQVYAATMDASGDASIESIPYFDIDYSASESTSSTTCCTAIIIGNEGQGLSPEVRTLVQDGAIQGTHIPMAEGIESLNAAICGSVILFDYARKTSARK